MDPLDIDRLMQATVDAHLDAHTRALTAAWVEAWEDVRAELDAAVLGKATGGDARRVRAALDVIEDRLTTLAEQAGVTITGSTGKVVALGAAGQEQMITAQLDASITLGRADAEQIDAIITRTTGAVALATGKIPTETLAVIRRRLNRGIIVGDNPRLVAAQIMRDLEGDFTGGLARALNISRTEMLTAMRTAQWATDQANKDVLRGWRWTCHADSRTCRSCLALDGTEYPVEEEGPDDHHSGRCARVPLTKSWAELGFQGVPETAVDFPDTGEWFESQDEATQRSILTPRGYDAWKRGDYPMSAWAERRENPGWRDTMVPSRPPK